MNPPATLSASLATPLPPGKLSDWILYLPAGKSTIDASLNGEPARLKVTVTAATAAKLQADLMARREGTILPFIDFDHEGKRASGWPTQFSWHEGKGVMLFAGWTPGGRAAVEAKEHNYFSPQFAYDPATETVLGLLPTGPIGGLVNDPAFRTMAALTAKKTLPDDLANPENQPQTPDPMNPELMKTLVASGLLTEAESTADNAAELLATRLAELQKPAEPAAECAAEAMQELEALKAKCALRDKDDAEKAVTAAVTAGRIAPKDTATQEWWKTTIIRDGAAAVQAMNSLALTSAVPADSNIPAAERPGTVQAAAALTEPQAAAVAARATILRKENGYSQQQAWAAAEAEIRAAVK